MKYDNMWSSLTMTKHFRNTSVQKQPPEEFFKKRCSYKFRKIHKKTLVPESGLSLQLYLKKDSGTDVFL